MGYTTTFRGQVTVTPPMNATEVAYLTEFNRQDHGAGYVGKYCQWEPTPDGTAIKWDDGEKFYDSVEWMQYLIDHFLKPDAVASLPGNEFPYDEAFDGFTFDHVVNGVIDAQGEDRDDRWRLIVKDNVVTVQEAVIMWPVDKEEDDW